MSRTAEDYANLIKSLLPRGRLWRDLIDDPLFGGLIGAVGEELARIEMRAADLFEETDPRTGDKLLAEWEDYYALPEPCITAPGTVQERRDALHAKRIAVGGLSIAYMIGVAAALGFVITIDEFEPWTPLSPPISPFYGQDWWFVLRVNAPLDTIKWWTPLSPPAEPLRTWGNEQLECVLERIKPPGTHIIFSYT